MDWLRQHEYSTSLNLLHKAEKIVNKNALDPMIHGKLLGVTYNNLGWYYKQRGKPQVALKYLNNAASLEKGVNDPVSEAGTYINISAILSSTGKHKAALEAAQRSLNLVNAKDKSTLCERTKIIALYNIGTELQHLFQYKSSVNYLQKGLKHATLLLGVEHPLTASIQNSLKTVYIKFQTIQKFSLKRSTSRNLARVVSHLVSPKLISHVSPSGDKIKLPKLNLSNIDPNSKSQQMSGRSKSERKHQSLTSKRKVRRRAK